MAQFVLYKRSIIQAGESHSIELTYEVVSINEFHERAIFGANCFWGAEAQFRKIEGVLGTAVGFMGDSLCDCTPPVSDQEAKDLNQVEVVVIDFDPKQVSYSQLIDAFWEIHNPTHAILESGSASPSRERSVIFTSDLVQLEIAKQALESTIASGRYDKPVTTVVEAINHFHRAAEAQQRYLERHEQAICAMKDTAAEAS